MNQQHGISEASKLPLEHWGAEECLPHRPDILHLENASNASRYIYPCLPIPSEGQLPLSSKNWTRRASERLDKLAAPWLGNISYPNKVSSATMHMHRNEAD